MLNKKKILFGKKNDQDNINKTDENIKQISDLANYYKRYHLLQENIKNK